MPTKIHTTTILSDENSVAWILNNKEPLKKYLKWNYGLFSEDDIHDVFMDLYLEVDRIRPAWAYKRQRGIMFTRLNQLAIDHCRRIGAKRRGKFAEHDYIDDDKVALPLPDKKYWANVGRTVECRGYLHQLLAPDANDNEKEVLLKAGIRALGDYSCKDFYEWMNDAQRHLFAPSYPPTHKKFPDEVKAGIRRVKKGWLDRFRNKFGGFYGRAA